MPGILPWRRGAGSGGFGSWGTWNPLVVLAADMVVFPRFWVVEGLIVRVGILSRCWLQR